MNSSKLSIEVGDKVSVYGYPAAVVSRVYFEDSSGNETQFESLCAVIRMELAWQGGGRSTVNYHDRNKSWFDYKTANWAAGSLGVWIVVKNYWQSKAKVYLTKFQSENVLRDGRQVKSFLVATDFRWSFAEEGPAQVPGGAS